MELKIWHFNIKSALLTVFQKANRQLTLCKICIANEERQIERIGATSKQIESDTNAQKHKQIAMKRLDVEKMLGQCATFTNIYRGRGGKRVREKKTRKNGNSSKYFLLYLR